jgi:hypothetical protein
MSGQVAHDVEVIVGPERAETLLREIAELDVVDAGVDGTALGVAQARHRDARGFTDVAPAKVGGEHEQRGLAQTAGDGVRHADAKRRSGSERHCTHDSRSSPPAV